LLILDSVLNDLAIRSPPEEYLSRRRNFSRSVTTCSWNPRRGQLRPKKSTITRLREGHGTLCASDTHTRVTIVTDVHVSRKRAPLRHTLRTLSAHTVHTRAARRRSHTRGGLAGRPDQSSGALNEIKPAATFLDLGPVADPRHRGRETSTRFRRALRDRFSARPPRHSARARYGS